MNRLYLSYNLFKNVYMKLVREGGYLPVYAAWEEDSEGYETNRLHLDMICEWRLPDGKVQFLEVKIETKEQFEEMIKYLCVAADVLRGKMYERVEGLQFPEDSDGNAVHHPAER